MQRKLAVIESASMNYFDRGILTVNAMAHYEDGYHQNVLNIVLDSWDKPSQKRVGTVDGMNFLIQLLQFFGVDNLTEVKDHYCYVLVEGEGLSIKAVGLEQLDINKNTRCSRKKIIYTDCFGQE